MRRGLLVALALTALGAIARTAVRNPFSVDDRRLWRIFTLATPTISSAPFVQGSPDFLFAPASGAGVGAACACAQVTSADGGVAIVVQRDGGATCTKHNEWANIAIGDVVDCAAGQPRIMPGGYGTGVAGLLIEGATTNNILRNEALSNAAWLRDGTGSTAPIVTEDGCDVPAPDGTSTADRVQFAATTSPGFSQSILYQSLETNGYRGLSVYIRGYADAGGTLDVSAWNASPEWIGGQCAYVGDSWTRCRYTGPFNNLAGYAIFGPGDNWGAGRTAPRPASDVCLWRPQFEGAVPGSGVYPTSAQVTSSIKTLGSAVTRQADYAYADLTVNAATLTLAASYVSPASFDNNPVLFLYYGPWDSTQMLVRQDTEKVVGDWRTYAGGASAMASPIALDAGWLVNSVLTTFTGSEIVTCASGQCDAGTASLWLQPGSQRLYIGSNVDGGWANGVVSQVSVVAGAAQSGSQPALTPATAWIGDSISTVIYGGDAPGKYATATGRIVHNYAVPGALLSEIRLQWQRRYYAFDTTVVVEGSVNNIIAGASGATMAAQAESLVEDIQADGFTVVWNNISPFKGYAGWSPAKQTEIDIYNAAFATYCGIHASPTLICVDFFTLMEDPGAADYLNPAYDFGDGIHLNSTGGQAWANQVALQRP